MGMFKEVLICLFLLVASQVEAIPLVCTSENMFKVITDCSRKYTINQQVNLRMLGDEDQCDKLKKMHLCIENPLKKVRAICPLEHHKTLENAMKQTMDRQNELCPNSNQDEENVGMDVITESPVEMSALLRIESSVDDCSDRVSEIASKCMDGYNDRVARTWRGGDKLLSTLQTCDIVQEVVSCFEEKRQNISDCNADVISSFDRTVSFMQRQIDVLDCSTRKENYKNIGVKFAKFYETYSMCKATMKLNRETLCENGEEHTWSWILNCTSSIHEDFYEFKDMMEDCKQEIVGNVFCDQGEERASREFTNCYTIKFWSDISSKGLLRSF